MWWDDEWAGIVIRDDSVTASDFFVDDQLAASHGDGKVTKLDFDASASDFGGNTFTIVPTALWIPGSPPRNGHVS